MIKADVDYYDFADKTDAEIIEIAVFKRKLTLEQDFKRHFWQAVKIYLGIAKGYTKKDLPFILEYAMRIQRILNNGKLTTYNGLTAKPKG